MYTVAGANLFGQWFSDKIILEGFERISKECAETNFDLDRAKLVQANWSYNIFDLDGTLFISGSWQGKDNQLVQLPLPEGLDKDATKNLLVAGNDKNIVLVEAEKQIIWIMDLKLEEEVQKVIFNTERPRQEDAERVTKRTKKIKQVLKVVMTNNACVYLKRVNKTTEVYTGLMPIFFDTDYCHGKVIDVQCGYEHYMLLTDTGKVYTWGNGRRLQLGHGNIDNLDRPREVRALGGIIIKKIRAGGWHTAVLSEYGDMYIWGWNNSGQLGIKNRAQRRKEAQGLPIKKKTHRVPTLVDVYDEDINKITLNVIDISCGSKHTAILLADYSIWITGSNEYGQLGRPTKDCTHVEHFVKVCQGTKDSFLRCGPWSTVIIK